MNPPAPFPPTNSFAGQTTGMTSKSESTALLPEIPGYELVSELGEGGFGVVYLARQLEAGGRLVALKMMLAGSRAKPEEVQRFRSEAEAVAAVKHPHVVDIYEVGTCENRPFFTMEYAEAGTLADQLQPDQPLPPRQVARLVEQIARGVAAAHAQGIVHRDLKPANVLMLADGTPKVSDFGIAKRLETQATGLTVTGERFGTPTYMAPEQAAGEAKRVGPAADVYALGVLLYRLLTGHEPFRGPAGIVLLRVLNEEVKTLRKVNPKLPRDLEVICQKALNKDPAKRYVGAAELAEDLRRWQANEPIIARPAGPLERTVKWVQRNRGLSAGLAAAVLALVAGTLVAWWQADLAHQARNLAEQERNLAQKQRNLAEQERNLANKRLAQIEELNQIFFDIFKDLDPNAKDKPLKELLADWLVDAANKLNQQSFSDVLKIADLQHRLGTSLTYLGYPDKAIPLFENALAIRREDLGEAESSTLQSLNNLAVCYYSTKQYAKALPLFTEALKVREDQLGRNHKATLKSLINLAALYYQAGDPEKALQLFEEACQRLKVHFPADDPLLLTSQNNLALCYKDTQQFDKALPLFEETLRRRRNKLGEQNLETLLSLQNLADAYRELGRWEEALELHQQAFDRRVARLGPDHSDTLISMHDLARDYLCTGQCTQAIALFEDTLQLHRTKYGKKHRQTLMPMLGLAESYLACGQRHKAEAILRRCLELCQATQPDQWSTFTAMTLLGGSLLDQQRYAEAEPLLVQGYHGMDQRLDSIPWSRRAHLSQAAGWLIELSAALGRPDQVPRWQAERDRLRTLLAQVQVD